MKNVPRIIVIVSLFAAMAVITARSAKAQCSTPLNLDANPSFEFGTNAYASPLFAPELLGLTTNSSQYAGVAALQDFADNTLSNFPPGIEVFLAYWLNPDYALLAGGSAETNTFDGNSSLALSEDFSPFRVAQTTVCGRSNRAEYTTPGCVIVNGQELETPQDDCVSPLVLDLQGSGVLDASGGLWLPHPSSLTGPYAAFDIDGDGFKDVTEWVGPSVGLLTTTTNVQSGRDLLGTAGGWSNGFQHLETLFDTNHSGIIEGAELNGLYVWQDLNGNGVVDPGEIVSVESLGITWISTVQSNGVSWFGYANGTSNLVWDWWPNYARANVRDATAAGGGLVGQNVVSNLAALAFSPISPSAVTVNPPDQISTSQLAAAGINLASFRIAALADGGGIIIGYDQSGVPSRVRLLQITLSTTTAISVVALPLPFEEMFQLAADPTGNRVLVIGNYGSEMALADFPSQTVAPTNGLALQSAGLRASGLAGWSGVYWFTAWQLDTNNAVIDELVWELTPDGFLAGLSLDALRQQFGQLAQYTLTSPESGFFVAPSASGQALWWINGTNQEMVAQADAFGGLAATPGTVAYTERNGSEYPLAVWRPATGAVIATDGPTPLSYPLLTPSGGGAAAISLSPETQTITYLATTSTAENAVTELLTTTPGQGKAAQGAFAHYGPNGIQVLPLADFPPAASTLFTNISVNPSTGGLTLQWSSAAHAFQLECAPSVLGPWLPCSPILFGANYTALGVVTNSVQFFRLRQW
jgi:hypothetical protein